MNKKYVVRLSSEERAHLEVLVSKGKAAVRKIAHAQVLLKVDADGPAWSDSQASDAFGVSTVTVRAIRERFVLEDLDSALNRKKPIKPSVERKLDGAMEARLLAVACGPAPQGRARWTLHLLADKLVELNVVETISYETVRRALKKTRLSPI